MAEDPRSVDDLYGSWSRPFLRPFHAQISLFRAWPRSKWGGGSGRGANGVTLGRETPALTCRDLLSPAVTCRTGTRSSAPKVPQNAPGRSNKELGKIKFKIISTTSKYPLTWGFPWTTGIRSCGAEGVRTPDPHTASVVRERRLTQL
jgi:hypothetical protein